MENHCTLCKHFMCRLTLQCSWVDSSSCKSCSLCSYWNLFFMTASDYGGWKHSITTWIPWFLGALHYLAPNWSVNAHIMFVPTSLVGYAPQSYLESFLFGTGTNRQNFQTKWCVGGRKEMAFATVLRLAPRRGIILLSSCLSKVSCIYVLHN